ncbi:MAG: ABC transporter permease [Spirochaetales bacterium]|nr:ABC transporter permease [Spirochaetales bacterium]
MKIIMSVLSSLGKSPVKSFLTLFTLGLGVGVLIIVLSISQFFSNILHNELEQEGLLVSVMNGKFSDSGELEVTRPPQWNESALSILKTDVSGVLGVSPLAHPFWQEVLVDSKHYRIRNAIATNCEYDDITGMKMILGTFFSEEDVEKGIKAVVISESLAKLLFGSAESALQQTIRPPSMAIRMRENGHSNNSATREVRQSQGFTITGIFHDFSELKRKAYGLADFVVPYTSILPLEMNSQMARMFLNSSYLLKVKGLSFEKTESQIVTALKGQYGDDLDIYVWEGSSDGQGTVLAETRQSITTFTIVVNLLGFLLLITGSIGILSIMLVEVLGKSHDIAIERALGAAKRMIIAEYIMHSQVVVFISIVIGLILSFVFVNPIQKVILPIVSNIDTYTELLIYPKAIFITLTSTIVIGGVFGVFPIFSVLRNNIAEEIKEG